MLTEAEQNALDEAFAAGYDAGKNGLDLDANPFGVGEDDLATEWIAGWLEAEAE